MIELKKTKNYIHQDKTEPCAAIYAACPNKPTLHQPVEFVTRPHTRELPLPKISCIRSAFQQSATPSDKNTSEDTKISRALRRGRVLSSPLILRPETSSPRVFGMVVCILKRLSVFVGNQIHLFQELSNDLVRLAVKRSYGYRSWGRHRRRSWRGSWHRWCRWTRRLQLEEW
jgi:hypothetical protein